MLNTVQNGLNFSEKQDMAIWQLFRKVVPTPRTTLGGTTFAKMVRNDH